MNARHEVHRTFVRDAGPNKTSSVYWVRDGFAKMVMLDSVDFSPVSLRSRISKNGRKEKIHFQDIASSRYVGELHETFPFY